MERPSTPDFDEFVRVRLPHLLRFGRALTGSEQAGADLVQDALERALPRWSRIAVDQPEAYVRRTMVNLNISVWRRGRRERLEDRVPDVAMAVTGHDVDLWRAVSRLPARQRAVVALRYYEDLSEAEIAAVLGCAPGTVKSQASKALSTLRRLLAEQGEGR